MSSIISNNNISIQTSGSGSTVSVETVNGDTTANIGPADTTDTFMTFIAGAPPVDGTVIYSQADNASVTSSIAGPVTYDIGSGGTGQLTINDFRQGIDSLAITQGVSVVSETSTAGATMIALSDNGIVVLMPALT